MKSFSGDNESFYLNDDSRGMFINMLRFYGGINGDPLFTQYLNDLHKDSNRKAGFTSHRFVRTVCQVFKNLLMNNVTERIIACGGGYALLIDSTSDVSMKNQLSIVLRWVDANLNINHASIAMIPLASSTGDDYYNAVCGIITKMGLDIKKAISSSTDGAKNMVSGFVSRLENIAEVHIHTHCCSHRLNLCLNSLKTHHFTSRLWSIINTIAARTKRSCKSSNEWTTIMNKMNRKYGDIQKNRKLKIVGETRWSGRLNALKIYFDSPSGYSSILYFVAHQMHILKSAKSSAKATENFDECLAFLKEPLKFVVAFGIYKILMIMQKSSEYSQCPNVSIFEMHSMIHMALDPISDMLNNVNNAFDDLVGEACQLYLKCHECVARLEETPLHDDFQFSITMDVLSDDHIEKSSDILREILQNIYNEFDKRFMKNIRQRKNFYDEIEFLKPRNVLKFDLKNSVIPPMEAISKFVKMPANDIHNSLNLFIEDYQAYVGVARQKSMDDKGAMQYLKEFFASTENQNAHRIVGTVYKTLLLVAVSQAECERNFSILKLLKGDRRSNLSDINLDIRMAVRLNIDFFVHDIIPIAIDEIAKTSKIYENLLKTPTKTKSKK